MIQNSFQIKCIGHRLGSDPNKLFPYEALQDQLKKFGKYGAITGSILLLIFYSDPKLVPDITELGGETNGCEISFDSLFQIPEHLQDEYHNRLIDLFEDSERFGYF